MRTRRRGHRGPEMLSRTVQVSSFSTRVGLYAIERRGEEPEIDSQPWLELRGTLDEPVREVRDVLISLFPREKVEVGTARPASVASVIQIRPHLSVVAAFPISEFDRLWTMALHGHVKYAYVYFTKPHYKTAHVVSLSFSNELEE